MEARTTPFTRVTHPHASWADRAMLDSLDRRDALAERVLDRLLATLGFDRDRTGGTRTSA